MSGPFVSTVLVSTVSLNPRQFDNNIYKHLKNNLIKKLEGKCYSKYGFIMKIYEILEYGDGYIVPENPLSCASFEVKFSCRLCFPIVNRPLICKIQKINKLFINTSNGPIVCYITHNRINTDIFYNDINNKLLAKKDNGTSVELVAGMFVKVIIESKSFNNTDKVIMAMGHLQNLATDDEIKTSFSDEYRDEQIIIPFETFADENNKQSIATEQSEEESEEESEKETVESEETDES